MNRCLTPKAPSRFPALILVLAPLFSACAAEIGGPEPEPGAPEEAYEASSAHRFAAGTWVEVCNFKGGLPLRQEPDPTSPIRSLLPEGTKARVLGNYYTWHHLDLGNRVGWAYGTALCPAGGSASIPSGASLIFQSPQDGGTVAATFSLKVQASPTIRKIEYWADSKYHVGTSLSASDGFAVKTTFTTLGKRALTAKGYDAAGQAVAATSITVTVVGTSGSVIQNMPYFYQYANQLYPGSSCQNTSVAMVLGYYGWKGTPDQITQQYGKYKAQSPAGLAEVFNALSSAAGLGRKLVAHIDGTVADVRALLQQGKPVIVHGYFTGSGHVIVLSGLDGTAYTANDPAGRWNEVFKGGYPSSSATAGKQVRYSVKALETAICSTNGYDAVPIWYHEVR